MSPRSFLDLPLEIRLGIYGYVFFRPCEIDRMGNTPQEFRNIKDALYDVDTAILGANKQVYHEAIPVAFQVNTFNWPTKPIADYPPFFRSLLHGIKHVFLTWDGLSQIRGRSTPNKTIEVIERAFPKHMTHLIVSAYAYRFTDMQDAIMKDILADEAWFTMLAELEERKGVHIRFLQHGPCYDELDSLLQERFPGCIMSKFEAGPEFNYRTQPRFQEDYGDYSFGSSDAEYDPEDIDAQLAKPGVMDMIRALLDGDEEDLLIEDEDEDDDDDLDWEGYTDDEVHCDAEDENSDGEEDSLEDEGNEEDEPGTA